MGINRLIFGVTCLVLAACDPNSGRAFRSGRAFNPCIETIPACAGEFAQCVLDENSYADFEFPGVFKFLVDANPDDRIRVLILFEQQQDSGLFTEIVWNEPGCSDLEVWSSDGLDIFASVDQQNVFSRIERVFEGGEHLIVIDSDMVARTSIGIEIVEPGEI
ncbi:MAG: hypothetical protein AAF605_03175 [Myxococcota bacterium]